MDDAARIRNRLVDRMIVAGIGIDRGVEAALRAVPRHAFLPEVSIDAAYADGVVAIKSANGVALSTASQPTMIALMLEQLRVEPGMRVLEIGTGSGYNAALLAELAGAYGRVVTIDIEADLAANAARRLYATGYGSVRIICGDGRNGDPHDAPFDRIIVTASAPSIAPSLFEQLREGGRLVAPIGNSAAQRSIAYERTVAGLRETGAIACQFIPLRSQ
ncbi:MAG TPA: methyltransferase domain-containing protein [Candidatus Baltobacteraceae bacterium]|jgi:protein-L-isoaspartate(D-aspartate) O-methyltransferase